MLAIWGALVIGGVYMLRAIRNIWHGEKTWPGLADPAGGWRKLPYGLLLACLIVLGCFPRLADRQHREQRRTGGADGRRRAAAGKDLPKKRLQPIRLRQEQQTRVPNAK